MARPIRTRGLPSRRRDVAELLSAAPRGKLSEMQIGEVLRIARSYADTDAVVIDWDAALVIDLEGYVDDVLYVLELANLQLEEYKVIDQRLDRYLDRVYDVFNRRQLWRDWHLLHNAGRFAADSRRPHQAQ